jgi:hypothetical protein
VIFKEALGVALRELLCFQKVAPEKVDMTEGMLDGFWNMISGEAHQ